MGAMANTYTQIYIQIVFAVEGRQNLIEPRHNEELQKSLRESFLARNKSSSQLIICRTTCICWSDWPPICPCRIWLRISKPTPRVWLIERAGLAEGFPGRKGLVPFPIHGPRLTQ
jgi:hypothetical protein